MKLANLKSMTPATKERRKKAIASLEKQLVSGTKPNKNAIIPAGSEHYAEISQNPTETLIKKLHPTLRLTEKDMERIIKEIEVLKTRI